MCCARLSVRVGVYENACMCACAWVCGYICVCVCVGGCGCVSRCVCVSERERELDRQRERDRWGQAKQSKLPLLEFFCQFLDNRLLSIPMQIIISALSSIAPKQKMIFSVHQLFLTRSKLWTETDNAGELQPQYFDHLPIIFLLELWAATRS